MLFLPLPGLWSSRPGICSGDCKADAFYAASAGWKYDLHLLLRYLGRSLFGHFVVKGLDGAADGWQGSADGRVKLHELAGYVRESVEKWS